MAADVSSLTRYLNGNRTASSASPVPENQSVPITRDLLGGGPSKIESEELDLDLHVPAGWEKRLDLKSGKVYIQRCSSTTSTTPSISGSQRHQTKLQDLNTPPYSPSKLPRNRSDDPCLDLKLVSSSSPTSSSNYQSVCTLDKVKSALERAEKEPTKRRSPFWKPSSHMQSPSCSSSSSSTRETTSDQVQNRFSLSPVAMGCPICLAYVLVSEGNPKCPRCNVTIPLPKKPKIDLNMSF